MLNRRRNEDPYFFFKRRFLWNGIRLNFKEEVHRSSYLLTAYSVIEKKENQLLGTVVDYSTNHNSWIEEATRHNYGCYTEWRRKIKKFLEKWLSHMSISTAYSTNIESHENYWLTKMNTTQKDQLNYFKRPCLDQLQRLRRLNRDGYSSRMIAVEWN